MRVRGVRLAFLKPLDVGPPISCSKHHRLSARPQAWGPAEHAAAILLLERCQGQAAHQVIGEVPALGAVGVQAPLHALHVGQEGDDICRSEKIGQPEGLQAPDPSQLNSTI